MTRVTDWTQCDGCGLRVRGNPDLVLAALRGHTCHPEETP